MVMNIYEIAPSRNYFPRGTRRSLRRPRLEPVVCTHPADVWTLVIVGIVFVARRVRGRGGERTLRDAYAKGEVNESEYRERLAVLRETRR